MKIGALKFIGLVIVLLIAVVLLKGLLDGASPPMVAQEYANPVIPGFHPDPSIVRVGDDYYLANSSFEYFPGIPIYHSRDLVNWRLVGHVLSSEDQLSLRGVKSSQGIWAPTLRHHNGKFYVVATVQPHGNYLFSADAPTGPWSAAQLIDSGGIDPSLFFDDDGTTYYSRQGEGGIVQAEIDLATGALKQTPRPVWGGTGGPHLEGPHTYKIDGAYYLLAAEGGTWQDHSVVVARSDSVGGPYESFAANPILTHKHLPQHPVQATGHADLVQLPSGGWWTVFLAGRNAGDGFTFLGRETFLAPVNWEDGWPVVNQNHPIELTMNPAPLLESAPWPGLVSRDEFTGADLLLDWVFIRGIPADWSLQERPGWLRLGGAAATMDDEGATPAFVAQRMQHFTATIRTRLEFQSAQSTAEAGLVFREDERNHYDWLITGGVNARQLLLRQTIDGRTEEILRRDIKNGPVTLEAQTHPDRFDFYFSGPSDSAPEFGGSLPAAGVRTRSFTGLMAGLYASGNANAYFDWFEYLPLTLEINP